MFLSALQNSTSETFERLAKICSIISFRYNIIGGLNPNVQEEVYNSVAVKLSKTKQFDVKDFEPIYVSDYSFENDFSTKEFKNTTRNHKIVKYILCKIEAYKFRNDIDFESDIFTVEHILPESADENWGDFSFDAINRSVYRIGNLTLLEKKLNREIGTLSYSEKCKWFSQSNCQLTKNLPDSYETWNEDKLAARQRDLARAAKSIWTIQQLGK